MTIKELCNDYIEKLIKKHKMYDVDILTKVMKQNKNEYTDKTLLDLSNYYDYLESKVNGDGNFMKLLNERYGYTKEYFEKQDDDWSELTESLNKTNKSEMNQLRESHIKHWNDIELNIRGLM